MQPILAGLDPINHDGRRCHVHRASRGSACRDGARARQLPDRLRPLACVRACVRACASATCTWSIVSSSHL